MVERIRIFLKEPLYVNILGQLDLLDLPVRPWERHRWRPAQPIPEINLLSTIRDTETLSKRVEQIVLVQQTASIRLVRGRREGRTLPWV